MIFLVASWLLLSSHQHAIMHCTRQGSLCISHHLSCINAITFSEGWLWFPTQTCWQGVFLEEFSISYSIHKTLLTFSSCFSPRLMGNGWIEDWQGLLFSFIIAFIFAAGVALWNWYPNTGWVPSGHFCTSK